MTSDGPEADKPDKPKRDRFTSKGQAAARFVGGGMRTVPAETRRVRLATCEACEHHTGTRCRLCGCFTAVKTQLPHERCPVAKWPV